MSFCDGRKGAGLGFRSIRMRTSTAVAPFFFAKIGFRSISAISGKIGDQLRDVLDDLGQRLPVDGVGPAHALQDLRALDALQHRSCFRPRCRREAEGDVLHHLDQHAAETEGHQLAEARVGDRADQDFLRAGRRQHLLHLDAVDARLLVVGFRVLEDRVVGLLRLGGAAHPDNDAAGVGLVQDVFRLDLHDDGKAEALGRRRRLAGRRRHGVARQRNLIGRADLLAFVGVQRAALGLDRLVEYGANRFLVDCHGLLPEVRTICGKRRAPGCPSLSRD